MSSGGWYAFHDDVHTPPSPGDLYVAYSIADVNGRSLMDSWVVLRDVPPVVALADLNEVARRIKDDPGLMHGGVSVQIKSWQRWETL